METNRTNNRKFYWFPKGLLDGDKVSLKNIEGVTSWKALVGFKTMALRDGNSRTRNWHFGIEALPRIGYDQNLAILPHVAFSENGELYESDKKQHSSRRNQCKGWYNNDWRDRILATLHYLADGKSEIKLELSPASFVLIAPVLETVRSPVSYVRTVDLPVEDSDDEDFPEDEEEDLDDE